MVVEYRLAVTEGIEPFPLLRGQLHCTLVLTKVLTLLTTRPLMGLR